MNTASNGEALPDPEAGKPNITIRPTLGNRATFSARPDGKGTYMVVMTTGHGTFWLAEGQPWWQARATAKIARANKVRVVLNKVPDAP